MNSSFKLLNLSATSFEDERAKKRGRPIDWSKCVLCQEDKNEVVVVPEKNRRLQKDEGYLTLDKNLLEFQKLGKVPCNCNIEALTDGAGIKSNLEQNGAKWHKSCFLKCADSKLKRLKNKQDAENISPSTPLTRQQSGVNISQIDDPKCVFCHKKATRSAPLQKIDFEKGGKVLKERATNISDTKMLVSLECKPCEARWCHKLCRTAYLYERRSTHPQEEGIRDTSLREVVEQMTVAREQSEVSPVFEMADVARLYATKMEEKGVVIKPHSSRLKGKLLEEFPELEASGVAGQKSLLRHKDDVDCALRAECTRKVIRNKLTDALDDVRRDMQDHPPCDWTDMSKHCSVNSVPKSLRFLVSYLLDGEEEGEDVDPVVSTIAELLFFHRRPCRRGNVRRHDVSRETPTPVYLAVKLYGETGSKELVNITHKLGLSLSYTRLQTILTERANRACRQYHEDGVVVPLTLEVGAFVTGQIDNFDHDTSSTTAKTSFHGTAISLLQHGPHGERRSPSTQVERNRRIEELPAEYTVVRPSLLDGKSARCPVTAQSRPEVNSTSDPALQEEEWLNNCRDSERIDTWPAHHSKETVPSQFRTRDAILPLFREKSSTMDMMAHGMKVIMKATNLLNPTQVPVVVADQPLYAICKQIQWLLPEEFGEDKVYVMMGAMHIEMAVMRVLGDWLEGSGWTSALTQAEVTTPGRAEALLSVSHIGRSRYAHQVSAAVLHDLRLSAYEKYCCDDPLTFEQWLEQCRSKPHFRYWDSVFQMQLACLQIVRALRTANFDLFNIAITRFVPYFFALDHQNYARWLPVHIRDNVNLANLHPSLLQKFQEGLFVAMVTGRQFSAIALDQRHEQLNKVLKAAGGLVGLTEKPSSMQKLIVNAPEVADIISKFESQILNIDDTESDLHHHFDSERARTSFKKDTAALRKHFDSIGNPFEEEGEELFNIDSRQCCGPEVIETVMKIEEVGAAQYREYCEERLEHGRVSIHTRIKRNQLATFARAQKAKPVVDKTKQKIKSLQNNVRVFGQMWVAVSNDRPGNVDQFFEHETQDVPPALVPMRSKSDLMNKCLAPLLVTKPVRPPPVDAMMFDGAVLMYLLKPSSTCALFSHFRDNVFLDFVAKQTEYVSRVDVVWDVYVDGSLKNIAREKRGEGIRTRVAHDTKIPKNWQKFLRDPVNKTELFEFLADAIAAKDLGQGITWYSTKGSHVVVNSSRDVSTSSLAPCNHEEADTRIFVHVADAVSQGLERIMIHTCDTDIIVLACAVMPQLESLKELWIRHTASQQHKYIAVHELSEAMGPQKSLALPAFHAFTGCDDVEGFFGIGKWTAWNTLKLQPEAVAAFDQLREGKVKDAEQELGKYVVTLYSPNKMYESVNKCRRGLFSGKTKALESIPPSEDALAMHTLRACYRAQVWNQMLKPHQDLPSPSEWGWQIQNKEWSPVWMTKRVLSKDIVTIVRCSCRVACIGNCKCAKSTNTGCCDLCTCVCNR